jgi:phage tail-like protein
MANRTSLIGRSSRISDYLINYRFHLMEVSFESPPVLSAGFGFKSISTPEINMEVKEIKEGNFEYRTSVGVSATVGDIELHQGVQFFNSDFYDWINGAIWGLSSYRRNFLLIHFSSIALLSNTGAGTNNVLNSFIPINDLLGYVPAKAWLLKGCIPIRYKSGSDFDALGGEISIAELTLRPTLINEFSLGL